MTNKTPGYYVEGRAFGIRHAQAVARAKHLATLYGRNVDVMHVDSVGCAEVNVTCIPRASKAAPVKVERGDWSAFVRAAVSFAEQGDVR